MDPPPKKNGGLKKMMFLFNWVIFEVPIFIFQNCSTSVPFEQFRPIFRGKLVVSFGEGVMLRVGGAWCFIMRNRALKVVVFL